MHFTVDSFLLSSLGPTKYFAFKTLIYTQVLQKVLIALILGRFKYHCYI